MTDDDFLTAMRIKSLQGDNPDRTVETLSEALQIDDLRSEYCQQLETRIAAQNAEIDMLRQMLGFK